MVVRKKLQSTSSESISFPTDSGAAKMAPHCVSLKKASLQSRGYTSFSDWNSDPNHVYIGRDMSHHIPEALGSKWGNPHIISKKCNLDQCLKRYEDHIRNDPDLFHAVLELGGKEIGCWCKPSPCHGDVLIKIFNEICCANACSLSGLEQSLLTGSESFLTTASDNCIITFTTPSGSQR